MMNEPNATQSSLTVHYHTDTHVTDAQVLLIIYYQKSKFSLITNHLLQNLYHIHVGSYLA